MLRVLVLFYNSFEINTAGFSFRRIRAESGEGEDAWRCGLVGISRSSHNHMAR